MGKTVWTKGIGGRFLKQTVPLYPDFWEYDFGEQFRSCRFDPRLLPNFSIEIADFS